jgi:hypothetical protein
MEDDGNLSSGPFVSRQQCLSKDTRDANGLTASSPTFPTGAWILEFGLILSRKR